MRLLKRSDVFPGAMLAQPAIAGVAHDRQQPGAAIPALKSGVESQGAQAGFLYDIFRILVVACQPARQIVGGVQMRQHSLLEITISLRVRQRLFPGCASLSSPYTLRGRLL